MAEDGDRFSVIIRCLNEERWIGHSIQSVMDFLEHPEIIIVNNRSSDDSMLIVNMFKHCTDIKIISFDDYSPGMALNSGIIGSKYDNIMILSAHCALIHIDVPAHLNDLASYKVIFGKQIPVYRGKKIIPRYIWSHFVDGKKANMISEIEQRPFVHNSLALHKKQSLIEHPFDEKLFGKEDRYWAADCMSKGFETLYDPALSCFHHWTPLGATWKGIG